MKETKDHFGMLLLFDAIGLFLTTIVLTMILSKLTGGLDLNVIVLSIFFLGIKVLLMGIADIVGIGKKIWVGILFILLADAIVLAVNVLMAFGISNKILLIILGIDCLVIILTRVIWKAVFSKNKKSVDEEVPFEKVSESNLDDYRNENEDENWTPSQFFEDSDELDNQVEVGIDDLQTAQSIDDPIVQVGTERLTPITEDNPEFSEFFEGPKSETEKMDWKEIDNADNGDFQGFDYPESERPSDAPNLNALDEFFGDSTEKSNNSKEENKPEEILAFIDEQNQFNDDIQDTVVLTDVLKKDEDVSDNNNKMNFQEIDTTENEISSAPSEIDELTQEMNRQFEVLQNRVDNLEQREADLKRREEAFKQSSTVTVRPQEVHLDNAESEIIINEDDLALLKAYLKQHPEI